MKLINREIEALLSKLEEEREITYKKELESIRTNPKVQKLAKSLNLEYFKMSNNMKKVLFTTSTINYDFWVTRSVAFLKLVPKTPRFIDRNTRRDIILASADSTTIEEVLTKLKLKK